ncbi:MAG: polyhydroxyalkanoate depolymerase [Alphaproteobacteria bacterium]|nr:polyhydroxyalkanoate depolymerase [Alphaproteobacteria bacterium]
MFLYHVYELNHAAIAPLRAAADVGQLVFRNPYNPLSYTGVGKTLAAAFDVFSSTTRRYGKPKFGLARTRIHGQPVDITETIVWRNTFCQLKRFKRDEDTLRALGRLSAKRSDPKVLIVAPMSGHYATLLRGTVEAMLPEHDVYITDWRDARLVPVTEGRFDLDSFIDYVMAMIRHLGPGTHVIAVCQPGPGVLAAASLMAEARDPATPASLVIMGSPIDARKSPTEPNILAESRPFEWFEKNMIMRVPFPHPGAFRKVYPGFVQLSSFISMNRDRHVDAHYQYYKHLVGGDGDSVQKHREFYDEYLAVMDLAAEFYLDTIDKVFQRHLLPKGEFIHRNQRVKPSALKTTALMTVEGEKDDISGIGQTQAAHELCVNIPASKQVDYIQPGVGHYGVFNGTRWRTEIQPRVRDFIRSNLNG